MAGDVYTGKAGSVTVFTLTINDNGTYTYQQLGQLDHADASNPDDIITLNLGLLRRIRMVIRRKERSVSRFMMMRLLLWMTWRLWRMRLGLCLGM